MVSKPSEDLPLPLGPVTTVNFPSARSRSIPLRLFWRAPRISMQPRLAGAITEFLPSTFDPTGNYSRMRPASQIFPTLCHPERQSRDPVKVGLKIAQRDPSPSVGMDREPWAREAAKDPHAGPARTAS